VRRPISSKPGTCTDAADVDAAGIKKPSEMEGLTRERCRQNLTVKRPEALPITAGTGPLTVGANDDLMLAILSRDNLLRAYNRVHRNKGAPGVDGMTVQALWGWLKSGWATVSIAASGVSGCMNRRGTEPYARWCGRTAGVTPPPARSKVW